MIKIKGAWLALAITIFAGVAIVGSVFRGLGIFGLGEVSKSGTVTAEDGKDHLNNPVAYDPSKCKQDAEGMVYFAAGRTVFRIPYEEPLSIRGMGAEERAQLPKRPDPSEPEGCPDNPIWGRGFSLPFRYKENAKDANDVGFNMRAKQLSIIASSPRNFGLQSVSEASFDSIKKLYSTCAEVIEGFIGCRMPSEDKKFMGDMELAAYQTLPDIYSTPLGGKLTVACDEPYASQNSGRDCNVDYKYYEDLNISYEFYRKDLPITKLLDYDSALRRYIDKIQVKDYQWAN